MNNINSVNLSGYLSRDPELRGNPETGTSILLFSLCVNDTRKNKQTGEWEDVPNFVDCVMFGNRAESVARYITKGSKVSVSGKLHYNSWEKDGQRRSKLEVYVNDIEFLSRQPQPPSTDYYNDDIPF